MNKVNTFFGTLCSCDHGWNLLHRFTFKYLMRFLSMITTQIIVYCMNQIHPLHLIVFFLSSLCLSLCGLNRSPSWPVWMPQLPPIPSPTTHRAVPTSATSFVIDTSWSRFWSSKSPKTSRSKQNNVGDSSSRSLISPSVADGFLKLPSPAFFANHTSARGTVCPSITAPAYIPSGAPLHFPPWGSPLSTPRASSSPGMLHQHSPSSPRGSPADAFFSNNHTQR